MSVSLTDVLLIRTVGFLNYHSKALLTSLVVGIYNNGRSVGSDGLVLWWSVLDVDGLHVLVVGVLGDVIVFVIVLTMTVVGIMPLYLQGLRG